MSKIHVLKNSETEAVIKVYTTEPAGESIDISLETWLTTPKQVYVAGASDSSESDGHFAQYTGSHVFITALWWGLKKDKIPLNRSIEKGANTSCAISPLMIPIIIEPRSKS